MFGKRRVDDRTFQLQTQIGDLQLRIGEISGLRERCKAAETRAEQAEQNAAALKEKLTKLTRRLRRQREQDEAVQRELHKTIEMISTAVRSLGGQLGGLQQWKAACGELTPHDLRARRESEEDIFSENRGLMAG